MAALALAVLGAAGGATTATAADRADAVPSYLLGEGELPPPVPVGTGFRADLQFPHDRQLRTVRVHVPSSARRPAPLLVALHGYGQSLVATEKHMGWAALAEQRGVIVAYGVGATGAWNAGTCCGRAVPGRHDDVGYLDRVLQLVAALRPVHPRHVHLTGFSNGAMMAYRYACERPTRVASVLGVAGTLVTDCPRRPQVAVMTVHGSRDGVVPLAGTRYSSFLRTPLRPPSSALRALGSAGRNRQVVLDGFGHAWPSRGNGGFDATAQGWAFLASRPRLQQP